MNINDIEVFVESLMSQLKLEGWTETEQAAIQVYIMGILMQFVTSEIPVTRESIRANEAVTAYMQFKLEREK